MNEKRNGALDRYPIEKKRAGRLSVTVKEDGAVIFYLYAPAAKIVQVAGLGGYFTNKKINLMPDGQGGFFAEVQDFHWGMHYYFWYVDDVCITNPHAAISYGCFSAIRTPEFLMGVLLRSILLRCRRRMWISILQRIFLMVRSASVNTLRR